MARFYKVKITFTKEDTGKVLSAFGIEPSEDEGMRERQLQRAFDDVGPLDDTLVCIAERAREGYRQELEDLAFEGVAFFGVRYGDGVEMDPVRFVSFKRKILEQYCLTDDTLALPVVAKGEGVRENYRCLVLSLDDKEELLYGGPVKHLREFIANEQKVREHVCGKVVWEELGNGIRGGRRVKAPAEAKA